MSQDFFDGARILITGASGSVGRELVKHLAFLNIKELRLYDNNEAELFFLMEAFQDDPRIHGFLGDVRDGEKLKRFLQNIDLVFHTAALKHIYMCERSPSDAVQTNILGVQNVIRAGQINKVKRVLFTSSDKAVNPTNVMGTTKLMGERLITAANALQEGLDKTIFASTRFGNVVGSRGSVIPIFLSQIESGGPVTLTDRTMTRFVMTVDDAVNLLTKSISLMCGGEVFITKMKVLRIEDLAYTMIELLAPYFGYKPQDVKVKEVGCRPGEKYYEELMTDEETNRSLELNDLFVTLPAFRNIYNNIDYTYPDIEVKGVTKAYHSGLHTPMSRQQIGEFLLLPKVLPENMRSWLITHIKGD